MLRSADKLKGAALVATDGAIGEVDDFYFDDERWAVRYLVVNTGTWLAGRTVLVSPISIKQVDVPTNQIFTSLTQRQVENSPGLDAHQPVSRRQEAQLLGYYGYPYYWGSPFLWGAAAYPAALAVPPSPGGEVAASSATRARPQEEEEESEDSHLRSMKEVTGYYIQAADGEIGHVEDFVVDDETWAVRYVVVDTRNWLPAKKVLVARDWVERVSWDERKVFVNLTREQVRNSPEYDPSALITREYEDALHTHYGRRAYYL
jgi:uncharacterized protein YrrD